MLFFHYEGALLHLCIISIFGAGHTQVLCADGPVDTCCEGLEDDADVAVILTDDIGGGNGGVHPVSGGGIFVGRIGNQFAEYHPQLLPLDAVLGDVDLNLFGGVAEAVNAQQVQSEGADIAVNLPGHPNILIVGGSGDQSLLHIGVVFLLPEVGLLSNQVEIVHRLDEFLPSQGGIFLTVEGAGQDGNIICNSGTLNGQIVNDQRPVNIGGEGLEDYLQVAVIAADALVVAEGGVQPVCGGGIFVGRIGNQFGHSQADPYPLIAVLGDIDFDYVGRIVHVQSAQNIQVELTDIAVDLPGQGNIHAILGSGEQSLADFLIVFLLPAVGLYLQFFPSIHGENGVGPGQRGIFFMHEGAGQGNCIISVLRQLHIQIVHEHNPVDTGGEGLENHFQVGVSAADGVGVADSAIHPVSAGRICVGRIRHQIRRLQAQLLPVDAILRDVDFHLADSAAKAVGDYKIQIEIADIAIQLPNHPDILGVVGFGEQGLADVLIGFLLPLFVLILDQVPIIHGIVELGLIQGRLGGKLSHQRLAFLAEGFLCGHFHSVLGVGLQAFHGSGPGSLLLFCQHIEVAVDQFLYDNGIAGLDADVVIVHIVFVGSGGECDLGSCEGHIADGYSAAFCKGGGNATLSAGIGVSKFGLLQGQIQSPSLLDLYDGIFRDELARCVVVDLVAVDHHLLAGAVDGNQQSALGLVTLVAVLQGQVIHGGQVHASEVLLMDATLVFGSIVRVACEVNHLRIILQNFIQSGGLGAAPFTAVGCVRQSLVGSDENGQVGVVSDGSIQLSLQPGSSHLGVLAVGGLVFTVDADEVVTIDHLVLIQFIQLENAHIALNSFLVGLLLEDSAVELVVAGNHKQLRCGFLIGEYGVPGGPELFVFGFFTGVTDITGNHNHTHIVRLELLQHSGDSLFGGALCDLEMQVTHDANLHIFINLVRAVFCGQGQCAKQLRSGTQQKRKHKQCY